MIIIDYNFSVIVAILKQEAPEIRYFDYYIFHPNGLTEMAK